MTISKKTKIKKKQAVKKYHKKMEEINKAVKTNPKLPFFTYDSKKKTYVLDKYTVEEDKFLEEGILNLDNL